MDPALSARALDADDDRGLTGARFAEVTETASGVDGCCRRRGRWCFVDADWPFDRTGPERASAKPTSRVTAPEHLAYAIYTSGSTGRAERRDGARIATVGNLLLIAMDERVGADPEGVWLAVTSISFDISVLELLWTLTRGFRVVVHPELVPGFHGPKCRERSRNRFARHRRHSPSSARRRCAAWRMEGGRPQRRSGSLKKLLLGGEALPTALARQVKSVLGGELLNMYGPTETTVWSTTCHVVRSSDDASADWSSGRQHGNMYVVDAESGDAVRTLGVAGELLIGGDGVGGYGVAISGARSLTAERTSSRIRFGTVPGRRGSIAPAISRAGCPTATSSSSAASITR